MVALLLKHAQRAQALPPPLGSAPARLLQSCLLRARLAALGSSALPGRGHATGAQPVPRVLELATSNVADLTAFDHPGAA